MNEHDIILFNDYKIVNLHNEDESYNSSDVEDEYLDMCVDEVNNKDEDDIYSEDHPWDTRSYTGYRFKPEIWCEEKCEY